MGRILLAACLSVGSLAAQKVLLADDRDRQAGVFSVRDLAGELADDELAEPAAARLPRMRPAGAKEIASLLEGGALHPGDHVEAVGPGHVVALGEADWIGKVESMLVQMRGAGLRQYQVNTRFYRVTEDLVAQLDDGPLRGIREATAAPNGVSFVLDPETAATLSRSIRSDRRSRMVQAPQVVAHELDRVRIRVGKPIDVRSPDAARTAEGLASPPEEAIWCGDDATLVMATTSKTMIGVSADVASQGVDLLSVVVPAPDANAPNRPATTVPVVRSCRAFASQEVADGATLVLAAQGSDGAWMVTMVTVEEIWFAGVPARRR